MSHTSSTKASGSTSFLASSIPLRWHSRRYTEGDEMPWRGPDEDHAFPTLGYDVGEWIEAHLVVPDGYRKGEPFVLTDEMWRFLIPYYPLLPGARPRAGPGW